MFFRVLGLTGGGPVHPAPQGKPRSFLPSLVTESSIVLCKIAPSIENTYEIRLAIFFAVEGKKTFELRIPPGAVVAPDLAALIAQYGGRISHQDYSDFTVTFTHFDKNKKERHGWVLGDRTSWESFHTTLNSSWLRAELKPGASLSGQLLLRFKQELSGEAIGLRNIDGEIVQEALQRLIRECESKGGYIRVQ
jgi:hypothetical protein